ncbi:MAG TPA: hypothetical protein DEG17_09300 [Cyanobacteria bacterium UBA11149]|nr:hypothetical protein [Cyanobacteria bacterium UBA11367]HBE57494.1 hypothetical protein [Cyanobacteria bacterium UBA11366]HBK66397.1 hypothetical protein [Cyanobacteria bacterium UBA11166]HBR73588.1 hypothetical protein [Cyanobacteria bacterium UBA11159]HBS68111.1 hypothetical protein [Cyanobacteria bacterium UBA11153]HBW89046.1 hypothetical protein [Cyanobacteria bacterium UBA11149]HCA96718.1 hypothetical protein [Cyanobacteria bacterium UBA9226]
MAQTALQTLKFIFSDRPDVLKLLDIRELDLEGRVDAEFVQAQSKRELFPEPVNFYATGRTSAGKTTLATTFIDPNQELAETIKAVLPRTGKTDCTWMTVFFQMRSNLRYFDLPGAGGCNETYENINRATLLLPQIDDEDEGLKPINEFELWNLSDYSTTKKVVKRVVSVTEWQAKENQQNVKPDIILYVVAPHRGFVREDGKYLRSLLRQQAKQSNKNKVIFALNIFYNSDGSQITTRENIEDSRQQIEKIFQEFYPNVPVPIVEVNCSTGTGVNKITELMCQMLPDNKIGNMGQVLQDELKSFAKKERSRRYRKALIYIASRLATCVVDQKLGDQDLLNEAYMAVADYGIRVFREEDARLEAEKELNDMIDSFAKQAKISRQEAIKKFVPDIEEDTVMESTVVGFKPKFKNVTIEEEVPDFYQETERVKRSAIARGSLGIVEGVVQVAASPISFIQGIVSAFGGMKEEDILGNKIHEQFDRDAYRNENLIKPTTRKVKRIQQSLDDIETIRQDVPKKIQKIVQKEQVVGQKSLQGGYPVVETILAIGLGIENSNSQTDVNDFEAIVNNGKSQVQALLGRFTDQINQLAVNYEPKQAEVNILKILEGALLN